MPKKRNPQAVVEDRIEIAASPTVLWTYFANLSKWPEWFPALVEVEWITGTPWTKGAQFRQVVNWGFPFGRVTEVATITEITPPILVTWEGRLTMVEAVHSFRFDATSRGTEVLGRHGFRGRLVWPARLLFLPRRVRSVYRAALERLKAYVETGKV